MVVGTGLLARVFEAYKENDAVVIFASGVSNSLETEETEFNREQQLLNSYLKAHPDKLFVYFSTCSVYDKAVLHRPYTEHKLKMENLVKENAGSYLIFRLSNIVGKGGNQHTIFNYLVNAVKSQTKLTLWKHATRNILDVEDMAEIVNDVIRKKTTNKTINVANINSYRVDEVVEHIEGYLDTKAILQEEDKGEVVAIEVNDIKDSLLTLNKDFSIAYIDALLEKYYDKA